ncbi:MAG: dihydrodipicolinate synthase family protein [Edaphobacter sp.]
MLLEGLQLPLTTPFYPDGRLNLVKLEHNVARYSKTPVAGLAVLSDCGEPTMLSDDETRQVLRSVADSAAAGKVLIAAVSRDSVSGTLELAEYATTSGYDAVLVKTPSVFRDGAQDGRTKELLTYFRAVADHSPLPVVLCSGAQRRGDWLPTEMVIELSGHSQIIGLVDGATTRERVEAITEGTHSVKHDVTVTAVFAAVTRRMQAKKIAAAGELIAAQSLTAGGAALTVAPTTGAKTRTKTLGFQILAGSAAEMLEALRTGAIGAMPAFAGAAPQACYEVLAAWKDGDERLAQEKQARLRLVAELMEGLGVAGIKFGSDLNGYFGGSCRLPLLPLTGEQRTAVETLLQGLRH